MLRKDSRKIINKSVKSRLALSSNMLTTIINITSMILLSLCIIILYTSLMSSNTTDVIESNLQNQLDTYAELILENTFGASINVMNEFKALMRARVSLVDQDNILELALYMLQLIASSNRKIPFMEYAYPKNGWGVDADITGHVGLLAGFTDSTNTSVYYHNVNIQYENKIPVGYNTSNTNNTLNVEMIWFNDGSGYVAAEVANQHEGTLAIASWSELCIGNTSSVIEYCSDGTIMTNTTAGTIIVVSDSGSLTTVLQDALMRGYDGIKSFVIRDGNMLIACSDDENDVIIDYDGYPYWNETNDPVINMIADKLGDVDGISTLNGIRIGHHIVSSANIPIGNLGGTVWTLFVAIPHGSIYGKLEDITIYCIGIAIGITCVIMACSWICNYFFVTKPLSNACDMIRLAATLNMDEIAEKSGITYENSGDDSIFNTPIGRRKNVVIPFSKNTRRQRYSVSVSDVGAIEEAINHMCETLLMISRYVPKELVEKTMKERLMNCVLRKKYISVLFCDLEGSTTALDKCEQNKHLEEFTKMLNEILECLTKVAQDHGGYVDKIIGDCVMVLFGAVNPLPNHERVACETAFDMQQRVNELYNKWLINGKYKDIPRLKIRVGIDSGDAFVGDVGSANTLMNYTVRLFCFVLFCFNIFINKLNRLWVVPYVLHRDWSMPQNLYDQNHSY